MKKLTIILLTLLVVVLAHGQLVQSFSGGDDLNVGPGTAGFGFTVGAASLTIQSLGIWDSHPETPLASSHAVGIWDAGSKALVGSATINPASAVEVGGYWYAPVAPLTLQAGHAYVLGAQYADVDFDQARGNVLSAVPVGITLGDALLSSGTGFTFPDIDAAGANLGFFGPNASMTPVPEPQMAAVLTGLALLILAGFRRRFDRKLDDPKRKETDLCSL